VIWFAKQIEFSIVYLMFFKLSLKLQNPFANPTKNFINARTTLNIDPVVFDLNGDGVKLTSYNIQIG